MDSSPFPPKLSSTTAPPSSFPSSSTTTAPPYFQQQHFLSRKANTLPLEVASGDRLDSSYSSFSRDSVASASPVSPSREEPVHSPTSSNSSSARNSVADISFSSSSARADDPDSKKRKNSNRRSFLFHRRTNSSRSTSSVSSSNSAASPDSSSSLAHIPTNSGFAETSPPFQDSHGSFSIAPERNPSFHKGPSPTNPRAATLPEASNSASSSKHNSTKKNRFSISRRASLLVSNKKDLATTSPSFDSGCSSIKSTVNNNNYNNRMSSIVQATVGAVPDPKAISPSASQTSFAKLFNFAKSVPAEMVPILTLLHTQKQRTYYEGYFMILNDLNSDGKPATERKWVEVFGKLTGTVLAIWDADSLERVSSGTQIVAEPEPTYINITDSTFKSIESLPSPNGNLSDVIVLSTTLKNRYLLQFANSALLQDWTAAFRLALFEYTSLQEAYTGALLSAKGSKLNGIRTLLQETKFHHEDWVSVRFGAGMPWKKFWTIVTPPTMKKKKGMPPPGTIAFYDDKKKMKKPPVAVISGAYAAYAVYPQNSVLVDGSTLIKVEGKVAFHDVDGEKDAAVFLMPEQHPGIPGFETLIRFLIPVLDVFCLYGRPKRLNADKADMRSLLFGMPTLPYTQYLELKDVQGLVGTAQNSVSWTAFDWTLHIKELLAQRLADGYKGCGQVARSNSSVNSGSSRSRSLATSTPPGPTPLGNVTNTTGAPSQQERNVSPQQTGASSNGQLRQQPQGYPGAPPDFDATFTKPAATAANAATSLSSPMTSLPAQNVSSTSVGNSDLVPPAGYRLTPTNSNGSSKSSTGSLSASNAPRSPNFSRPPYMQGSPSGNGSTSRLVEASPSSATYLPYSGSGSPASSTNAASLATSRQNLYAAVNAEADVVTRGGPNVVAASSGMVIQQPKPQHAQSAHAQPQQQAQPPQLAQPPKQPYLRQQGSQGSLKQAATLQQPPQQPYLRQQGSQGSLKQAAALQQPPQQPYLRQQGSQGSLKQAAAQQQQYRQAPPQQQQYRQAPPQQQQQYRQAPPQQQQQYRQGPPPQQYRQGPPPQQQYQRPQGSAPQTNMSYQQQAPQQQAPPQQFRQAAPTRQQFPQTNLPPLQNPQPSNNGAVPNALRVPLPGNKDLHSIPSGGNGPAGGVQGPRPQASQGPNYFDPMVTMNQSMGGYAQARPQGQPQQQGPKQGQYYPSVL